MNMKPNQAQIRYIITPTLNIYHHFYLVCLEVQFMIVENGVCVFPIRRNSCLVGTLPRKVIVSFKTSSYEHDIRKNIKYR